MNLNKTNTSLIYASDPKLTGNVKIVASEDSLYLNSIENNDVLKDVRLQKYKIHKNWNYGEDLSNFWLQGKGIFDAVIYLNKEYRLFEAGPRNNDNIYYPDNFSYTAPLWFNGYLIPDYFLIFKINDFKFNTQKINDFDIFAKNSIYKSEIGRAHV